MPRPKKPIPNVHLEPKQEIAEPIERRYVQVNRYEELFPEYGELRIPLGALCETDIETLYQMFI